ncbi:hypothetical protein MTO96_051516 [Rhipicephalus appendiculatus]
MNREVAEVKLHTKIANAAVLQENKGSLVVDEMAIKQVATYVKKADRVHGLLELGGVENELGIENELATHLLAFVFVGLSTHYTHSMNKNRKLFLAFDHCHILKNLRNQLLALNRLLCNRGDYYSRKYLRMPLDINERQKSFKLVRRLTRKHVFPTNFEKMHVGRAVDAFSTEVYV